MGEYPLSAGGSALLIVTNDTILGHGMLSWIETANHLTACWRDGVWCWRQLRGYLHGLSYEPGDW